MLALELGQLEENPSEVQKRVHELRNRTTEISDDVQALSHELHASKLEYLGALGGIKSWCKEFGERHGIQIDFTSPEETISLPPEIGLCLFRVLQEALHNVAKYSGVKRAEVQLREDSDEIHLLVSDLGRGFDLETAIQGRGLGLTSMKERVRLVSGILEIQSKPRGGTTVHVRVPVRSEPTSQRAVG
jgi:signal transduction histidine kinase